MLEQFIKREPDVFSYLAKQDWGDVAPLMKRNCGAAARGIAELFVGSALANFCEAEFYEDGDDFIGIEDGNMAHDSCNGDVLNPDKLGLQHGFSIFQKHCNNFVQIVVDLIKRFSLGMGTGEAGNKTNEQASFLAALNYS